MTNPANDVMWVPMTKWTKGNGKELFSIVDELHTQQSVKLATLWCIRGTRMTGIVSHPSTEAGCALLWAHVTAEQLFTKQVPIRINVVVYFVTKQHNTSVSAWISFHLHIEKLSLYVSGGCVLSTCIFCYWLIPTLYSENFLNKFVWCIENRKLTENT